MSEATGPVPITDLSHVSIGVSEMDRSSACSRDGFGREQLCGERMEGPAPSGLRLRVLPPEPPDAHAAHAERVRRGKPVSGAPVAGFGVHGLAWGGAHR